MSKFDTSRFSSTIIVLSHVVVWLLFLQLVYDLVGVWEAVVALFYDGENFIDDAILIIPSLIGFFYWNNNFLIPKFLNAKSWWKYLISLIISFIILISLGYALFTFLLDSGFTSNIDDPIDFFDFSLTQHLFIIAISTSLGISKIAMENDKQKKEAIAKQRETELNYLKAQVSPHFLFNTLNTIYSLANDEGSPQTSEAIIKLSENMRYMVREATKDKVPLQQELDFLQSYIDLQLLRLSGNAEVNYSVKGKPQQQHIAPLLLIPFIENVFKHGVSYQQASPIFIELTIASNTITLKTENTIKKQNLSTSTGAGLENTRKRLLYLYPDKHQLAVQQKEGKYTIELIIWL